MNNSNKKNNSMMISYIVVFLLYIASFILIPFPKYISCFTSLLFTILAFVFSYIVSVKAFEKEWTKSKLFGFPIFKIWIIYLLLQVIISYVIFIVSFVINIPMWITILLCLFLLGFAVLGVVATENARVIVEKEEETFNFQTKEITYFKANIDGIHDMCKHESLRKPLEKLIEQFRFSDPVSSEETKPYEEQLNSMIGDLRSNINSDNTLDILNKINEISNTLSERNRICKLNKK